MSIPSALLAGSGVLQRPGGAGVDLGDHLLRGGCVGLDPRILVGVEDRRQPAHAFPGVDADLGVIGDGQVLAGVGQGRASLPPWWARRSLRECVDNDLFRERGPNGASWWCTKYVPIADRVTPSSYCGGRPGDMSTIELDGIRVGYEIVGAGGGPPVVLPHARPFVSCVPAAGRRAGRAPRAALPAGDPGRPGARHRGRRPALRPAAGAPRGSTGRTSSATPTAASSRWSWPADGRATSARSRCSNPRPAGCCHRPRRPPG